MTISLRHSLQRFFSWQVDISRQIDRRFFRRFSADGNEAFYRLVFDEIGRGMSLAEIGGGKTPLFTADEVAERRLRVIGVDIDGEELARAPNGSYASILVGPIEDVRGQEDCDYVIAQSVLEHVRDGKLTALGVASFARAGGRIVTFCPCRRAWFARLNLLLPESLKRAILFYVFPSKRERQGFPAFYDGCTPSELVHNMRQAGIEVEHVQPYFVSSYFMFFVPLYLLWRLATWPLMTMWPMRHCETFIFVGRKI